MDAFFQGGRRAEFDALNKAYIASETAHRLNAKPQLVVVTGPSGIGKSFFVGQSLDIICNQNEWDSNNSSSSFIEEDHKNFVISGKCNEMNQNQPYSCILDALSMLCSQLRHLDLLLDSIQQEIVTALNGEGQVLIDFVPAMLNVIGDEHEDVYELKGRERQIRLERVIRRFVGVVASYCPVVIQLDDLQWVSCNNNCFPEFFVWVRANKNLGTPHQKMPCTYLQYLASLAPPQLARETSSEQGHGFII